MKQPLSGASLVISMGLFVIGCGSAGVKASSDGGTGGTAMGSGGSSGSGGSGPTDGPAPPPVGFTMTESGGYKLGDPVTSDTAMNGGGSGNGQTCNSIVAIVRDFRGVKEPMGHPDFESFEGRGPTLGLVAPDLGADKKPVYASKCEANAPHDMTCPSGQMTTSKAMFDQWYRNVDGVNLAFKLEILLAPGANGVATFNSTHYFPLGDKGFGYSGKDDMMRDQNFGFTTEIHTTFKYGGGESFTFVGDDDLWVFINGKLAIDIGGLHYPEMGSVDLDQKAAALGISKGNVYPMDLFQAERHSIGSDVRIDTNFAFVNCGTLIP